MEKHFGRCVSFIIITLVYALAGALGVVCYMFLPIGAIWARLFVADVIATVVVFMFSLLFKNASVYDPYWSVQPIVIAVGLAISAPLLSATGILVLVAIVVWGVRLTANWAYTFHGLEHEDWRYRSFREKSNKYLFFVINLFGFHMMPTVVVFACMLPAVYIIMLAPTLSDWSVLCFMLSLAAVLLQGVADCQMHKFRKRGMGGFIRTGVWKHTRHPNYLAEILMWWSIYITLLFELPHVWYLFGGAVLNTLMFIFISVPLADGRQSRKDGFSEYKMQTRMLLPIPKFRIKKVSDK